MKKGFEKPFFSVIIPTLNEEKHLPLLLNDLTTQTFQDFETIIVDAKSNDKTIKKANIFKNKIGHLNILTSPKRNVSYQRNYGAKHSKSGWFVFMDADNRIPSYFLQGIKYQIEKLNPDILSTWIKPDSANRRDKAAANIANLYIDLQKNSARPQSLESFLCFNKRSFLLLKGFNENISWAEGSELLNRARKKKMKFVVVRDPKYTFSFRRLRKLGTLKSIRKVAELELSRLVRNKLPDKTKKYLYPMEGGSYYEIGKEEQNRVEKLFEKIIQKTQTQIKNGNGNISKKIKKYLPRFLKLT